MTQDPIKWPFSKTRLCALSKKQAQPAKFYAESNGKTYWIVMQHIHDQNNSGYVRFSHFKGFSYSEKRAYHRLNDLVRENEPIATLKQGSSCQRWMSADDFLGAMEPGAVRDDMEDVTRCKAVGYVFADQFNAQQCLWVEQHGEPLGGVESFTERVLRIAEERRKGKDQVDEFPVSEERFT